MAQILTRDFGVMEYAAGEQFEFPTGLPGFPRETFFLPIEVPEQFPLLYLQSVRNSQLCFVALPVKCIVPDFKLCANAEDLAAIGLAPDAQPGPGMLCLALICFTRDGMATANLRAPIIVNVKTRMGVQSIQSDDRYPFRFPVHGEKEATVC